MKAFILIVIAMLLLVSCRQAEPAVETSLQETNSQQQAESGLEDIDSVESDLSSDELDDMEDGFSEIESI